VSAVAAPVRYDEEADVAYVALADSIDDGALVSTRLIELAVGGPLLLELDDAGRLLGIEVLQAARALPPELIGRLTTRTGSSHGPA
jgi:uncharacterized protein YuzE